MAVEKTYKEIILEEVVKEILAEGSPLTLPEIESRFTARTEGIDFTQPQFDEETAQTSNQENASAAKWNATNNQIKKDLVVSYKEMFKLTDRSVKLFERQRTESAKLEGELKELEGRINRLVDTQTERDTHYVNETFDSRDRIDGESTTANIDIKEKAVRLDTTTQGITKINLNRIKNEDMIFTVLSRADLIGVDTPGHADPRFAFDDTNRFWQSRVIMRDSRNPVTTEFKAKIASVSSPKTISKIEVVLHAANINSAIQITPMFSTDGVNFNNLNSNIITLSTFDKATFRFKPTKATHIKFLFTKSGYDFAQDTSFIYEFGAKEISLFREGFGNTIQTVRSSPLSVLQADGNLAEFDELTLDTCESVPENTNIDYFLAVSDDPLVTGLWLQVDPKSRDTDQKHDSVLNVGDIDDIRIDDVAISFNPTVSGTLQNPAPSYFEVTTAGSEFQATLINNSKARYHLVNSNDRILDHQLSNTVPVLPKTIEIFRNTGSRGDKVKVRGVQRGWRFQEPWYTTIIDINRENGLTIDFGEEAVIIDEEEQTGTHRLSPGLHKISVHKNNWVDIKTGLSLENLKSTDSLFPFNHKLLIEGYTLADIGNPYTGVDIFTSHYLKQVPIADFLYNIDTNDLTKFAIDVDAEDPTTNKESNTVFVVKSNENRSDFLDEKFIVRFNVKNQLFKYFWFRADLSTEDTGITPLLDSYSIKINS